MRVEAATLARQYNDVEELLLQAENILETAGIALDAEAQVSLKNSISARDKGKVFGVGFLNSRHLYQYQ